MCTCGKNEKFIEKVSLEISERRDAGVSWRTVFKWKL
jgi:hypothetical protein